MLFPQWKNKEVVWLLFPSPENCMTHNKCSTNGSVRTIILVFSDRTACSKVLGTIRETSQERQALTIEGGEIFGGGTLSLRGST